MALAGIELRYLVGAISGQAAGYYVSNIYGVASDSMLFKLHHTSKPDLFLMVSSLGIWLTSVRVGQVEPNRMQRRLRGDLLRLRLSGIRQIGAERIAYLAFEGFGKEFTLVVEFFGDGNMLLCGPQMKILALQHSIDVRHRRLAVGLEYAPPPHGGLDIFGMAEGDMAGLGSSGLAAARWVGRSLGLPKKYVEGIMAAAGVDPSRPGTELSAGEIGSIFREAGRVAGDVAGGNHTPVITRDGRPEAHPVRLAGMSGEPAPSYMEALDSVLTEELVGRGQSARSAASERRVAELESQIAEQDRAIETVKERSRVTSGVANSLYAMISSGITSITDARAVPVLSGGGARLATEKGVDLVVIGDQKIPIDYGAPLQSIASALFDEAKRQSRAIGSIEAARERAAARLGEARAGAEAGRGAVAVSRVRRKSWYERYRWFLTSGGLLAVGGRDAASNSAVVRKHMEKGDRVFHADIFGSPFFILKGGEGAPDADTAEVAHATVCFSRAWREGLYGTSSYWVAPEQVKRSAPSGEFLPKGSFTIEGQRNLVKADPLRLAVGIAPSGESHVATCGPAAAVQKHSALFAVIEPQGIEMMEAAKRIMEGLARADADAVRDITLDDLARVLPAGRIRAGEVRHGDLGAAG